MSQHEHYQEIADKIDQYPAMDKDFMLWYLLGKHREYLDRELEKRDYPADGIQEYAVRRMMLDHLSWTEDIRNVLQEVIF